MTTCARTITLKRGGSGEGITGWLSWGTGCLLACDLQSQVRLPLTKNLTIGSMVHGYLEAWRSGQLLPDQPVDYIDDDGTPIDSEWQAEAKRLCGYYTDNRTINHYGAVLATELHITDPAAGLAVGVSPYTAQIDLLAGTKDDTTLIDYKTASSSGNRYATGRYRLQMHAYWLAATAIGYRVRRIVVEQITKTKVPKINEYEIDLPTPGQIAKLRQFLAAAKHRRACGDRIALLPLCDTCEYRTHGHCV